MRPSEIVQLTPGIEGITVEAAIGVVFDRRDGKFGPTQDIRIKDSADAPREEEITLRLRDRADVPREARGRTVRVMPGEYKGKRTGVKWNVRRAIDGREFREVVVSRSARVEIEGLGAVPALPKTEENGAGSSETPLAGKAAATPVPAPVPASASPKPVNNTSAPAAPAPQASGVQPGRNGNGKYTAEDLVALAGYFAPKVLALGLPESAVGQVLDGLLRVATVTGTRPPEPAAPAVVIPILKAPSKDQIEFALKTYQGDITGLLEAAHEAGADANAPEEIPIPVLKKVVLDRINNAKVERTRAAAAA